MGIGNDIGEGYLSVASLVLAATGFEVRFVSTGIGRSETYSGWPLPCLGIVGGDGALFCLFFGGQNGKKIGSAIATTNTGVGGRSVGRSRI